MPITTALCAALLTTTLVVGLVRALNGRQAFVQVDGD